jgi:hypothetical protein
MGALHCLHQWSFGSHPKDRSRPADLGVVIAGDVELVSARRLFDSEEHPAAVGTMNVGVTIDARLGGFGVVIR